MCGIAGIAFKRGSYPAAPEAVRQMIAMQRHRGPDGEGFYAGDGIALGHCRLAIIDLSDAGHQPMGDPLRRLWITFNGEIYNYVELGRELRERGYSFRGHSDTEVLLAAYREWGEGCVARLRGMFAFAIWDTQTRRLFAARDRLGIKPFHYVLAASGRFIFASEIKALLPFLPERRPNLELAQAYLAWNLLDHEAGETMCAGVRRLPPAHTLTWTEETGLRQQRYWEVAFNDALATPPARRRLLAREFRERFEETVALHLRSDVPVGSCLSGGLDSSSIVCAANQELRRRGHWREDWQHAFSACFDIPSLDERPYIQEVVKATGCQPHFVFPNGEQLRLDLEAWLWHQEEPVTGTPPYAHYCVARLAREHGIKVLLDGQGADEQLAGYRKFILVYLRQLLREGRYARSLKEAAAFFASIDILRTCRFAEGRRYLFNRLNEVAGLFPHGPRAGRPSGLGIGDSLARRLEADVTRFSLPVLLRYEDRNTMAFGIEARVPFVDHVLVEWLAALPGDLRLANGWTKRVLREGLAGVLPERIRRRKSKLGFSTPEAAWLGGPLAGWVSETLRKPWHLEGVVEIEAVSRLRQRFAAGERSLPLLNVLFRLAIFETWARRFLEVQPQPPPATAAARQPVLV